MPILPPSLENFLDAPVPYIMGLLRPTVDVELYKRGTVGILDIDNGMYSKIYTKPRLDLMNLDLVKYSI